MQPVVVGLGAALALGFLWYLARGRAAGATKRALLRVALLGLVLALVTAGLRRGVFAQATLGFRAAILLSLLSVAVGYLYLLRFCPACGRLVRDLKPSRCPRCGAFLPRHGMTMALRREGDDARWEPRRKTPRP